LPRFAQQDVSPVRPPPDGGAKITASQKAATLSGSPPRPALHDFARSGRRRPSTTIRARPRIRKSAARKKAGRQPASGDEGKTILGLLRRGPSSFEDAGSTGPRMGGDAGVLSQFRLMVRKPGRRSTGPYRTMAARRFGRRIPRLERMVSIRRHISALLGIEGASIGVRFAQHRQPRLDHMVAAEDAQIVEPRTDISICRLPMCQAMHQRGRQRARRDLDQRLGLHLQPADRAVVGTARRRRAASRSAAGEQGTRAGLLDGHHRRRRWRSSRRGDDAVDEEARVPVAAFLISRASFIRVRQENTVAPFAASRPGAGQSSP